MGAAKLSDPSAMFRSLIHLESKWVFQSYVFIWIERAAGAMPKDLWLLDSTRENLGRFVRFDPTVLLDEDLAILFQSHKGAWTTKLPSLQEVIAGQIDIPSFVIPFFGGRNQSLGLITFEEVPKGAAWVRLMGLVLDLYLSRHEQDRERQTLDLLLEQAKDRLKEVSEEKNQRTFSWRKNGSLRELRRQFERTLILDRLSVPNQTKTKAAASLGITYRSLADKCKSLGI